MGQAKQRKAEISAQCTMKTFEITVSMSCWKTITVQAESEDDINVWEIDGILDDLEYSAPEIDDVEELEAAE